MFLEGRYTCATCGELIETGVDPDQRGGYIEDCQVCCRPNRLTVSRDPETGAVTIDADPC